MEKDPAARYQSMTEMGQAIAEAQQQLGTKQPVEQIPRKGLHQRATFVRDRRVPSPPGETPMDAGLPQKMAAVAVEAPTLAMDAVLDPDAVVGTAGTVEAAAPPQEPSTVLDQRLPTHVREAIKEHHDAASTVLKESTAKPPARSTPATAMSRDGAGNLTTGPRGMMAPTPATPAPPPAKPGSGSVPTLLSSQAPTMVREIARADSAPSQDILEEAKGFRSNTGRYVLIAFVAIAVAGIALAILLRH
jgi:hypothetical protein